MSLPTTPVRERAVFSSSPRAPSRSPAQAREAYISPVQDDRAAASARAKLTNDMRRQVRRVESRPFLHEEWFFVAEAVHRADILADAPLPDADDSHASPDATLWERDGRDSLLARFVVEECKLTPLLREAVQLRESTRDDASLRASVMAAAKALGAHPSEVFDVVREHETRLASVLGRCFAAVECLQTIDQPALVGLIADSLARATEADFADARAPAPSSSSSSSDGARTRTTRTTRTTSGRGWGDWSVRWCESVFATHLSKLDEDRVMSLARDEGVFAKLAHALDTFGGSMSPETMASGLRALSGMCETEFFSTVGGRTSLLLDDERYRTASSLRTIKALRIDPRYEGADPAEVRGVRGLVDATNRLQRESVRRATGRRARPQSGRELAERIRALSTA